MCAEESLSTWNCWWLVEGEREGVRCGVVRVTLVVVSE